MLAAVFLAAPVQAADSAELDEFKKQIAAQLDAMKAGYEARIQKLETRLTTVESENARLQKSATKSAPFESAEIALMKQRLIDLESTAPKPSPTAVAAAQRAQTNAAAIARIERQIAESATESRDRYRIEDGGLVDVTKLHDLPRPFEFHGYLRSGYGLNGEGGKAVAFIAPGAGAKYRLGNETETYGELGLTHNWLREDDPLKLPYVRSTVMLSYSTGENGSYDSLNNLEQGNDIALRQAYIEAGNVIRSMPEIRFWGGQRYYRRHDIHINDFYFLDMSGYGAGVEDVPVGTFGKAALAWIGGSVDRYTTENGAAAKSSFDLRLYDVKVPLGEATFWLTYGATSGGEVRNVYDLNGERFSLQRANGWAAGFIHRTEGEKFFNGYNELSVQYGTGAAFNFISTVDVASPDLREASRFRVTDHFTIQPSKHFAMQAVGLYQNTTYGGPNSREEWYSVGLRPIWFFNDRFSVALETGVDWVNSQPLGTDGSLWKITLAPQLSRGDKFFSRPVARLFVTYAQWSDGFKGKVGGDAYANALEGLSYGVQVEAWW